MYDFFDSLANVIVDRSPDELIGAVIVALGLSLAFAGVDLLAGRKVRQGRILMIGLMIGGNLLSMAIAAGYLVHKRRTPRASASERGQTAMGRPYFVPVESAFRAADENRDGLVSSEEAANAAADFVRRADPTGKGLIDAPTMEQAIPSLAHRRGRRSGGGAFPPPPRTGSGPRPGSRRRDDGPVRPMGPPPPDTERDDGRSPIEATGRSDESPGDPRQNHN